MIRRFNVRRLTIAISSEAGKLTLKRPRLGASRPAGSEQAAINTSPSESGPTAKSQESPFGSEQQRRNQRQLSMSAETALSMSEGRMLPIQACGWHSPGRDRRVGTIRVRSRAIF